MTDPTTTIMATFDGTAFVPDGPLIELVPGQRVLLTFGVPLKPPAPWPEPRRPDESFIEFIDRIAVDDPDAPTDLAAQHDHDLYGTPKR